MKKISDFISVIGSDRANLTINSSLYNIEAIHAACYAFTDRYHILVTIDDNTLVTVIFELKDKDYQSDIAKDIKEFSNAIIDHQVRLQLDHENGKIRDLIVAHAFSPFDIASKVINL